MTRGAASDATNREDGRTGEAPPMALFDAHLHIIDPRFAVTANQGYRPPAFTVADYRAQAGPLGITGGAVVAGSFQGFDPEPIIAAVRALGAGFVGVAQLASETSEEEIARLAVDGLRAVRFNLRRGMCPEPAAILDLAMRAHRVAGWHAELYLDAAELPNLAALVDRLPAVCFDHLGLTRRGLPHLLRQVERGAKVKASGFARLDFPAAEAIRAIVDVDPAAILFGTDLPGTRAPRPFAPEDLEQLAESVGDGAQLRRLLHDNAVALYRPNQVQPD